MRFVMIKPFPVCLHSIFHIKSFSDSVFVFFISFSSDKTYFMQSKAVSYQTTDTPVWKLTVFVYDGEKISIY